MTIRPIRLDDIEGLWRLFFRLSPETVYRRFFRPIQAPSVRALEHLVSVDHHDREAVVAEVDREIIGVARYDRRPGATTAEVAVVVEDAWQGRGVGRELVQVLGRFAAGRGLEAFEAVMLGGNRGAVRFARHLAGRRATLEVESGEVVLRSPLVPAS